DGFPAFFGQLIGGIGEAPFLLLRIARNIDALSSQVHEFELIGHVVIKAVGAVPLYDSKFVFASFGLVRRTDTHAREYCSRNQEEQVFFHSSSRGFDRAAICWQARNRRTRTEKLANDSAGQRLQIETKCI